MLPPKTPIVTSLLLLIAGLIKHSKVFPPTLARKHFWTKVFLDGAKKARKQAEAKSLRGERQESYNPTWWDPEHWGRISQDSWAQVRNAFSPQEKNT